MSDTKVQKKTPASWEVSPMIQDAVNNFIKTNPEGYRRAQEFGEFLMNSRMADPDKTIEKRDVEGDDIMLNKIKRDIKFLGITQDDLNEFEIGVLKRKLGEENWHSLFEESE